MMLDHIQQLNGENIGGAFQFMACHAERRRLFLRTPPLRDGRQDLQRRKRAIAQRTKKINVGKSGMKITRHGRTEENDRLDVRSGSLAAALHKFLGLRINLLVHVRNLYLTTFSSDLDPVFNRSYQLLLAPPPPELPPPKPPKPPPPPPPNPPPPPPPPKPPNPPPPPPKPPENKNQKRSVRSGVRRTTRAMTTKTIIPKIETPPELPSGRSCAGARGRAFVS